MFSTYKYSKTTFFLNLQSKMRNKTGIQDMSKLIFMTQNEYLLHLGDHYQDFILKAKENMEPVVRLVNINGTYSSIPLERALQLLEKYHKITQPKTAKKKKEKVVSIQPSTEATEHENEKHVLDGQKQMA